MPRRLHAVDFDVGIVEERMKQAHRIRAATDTGNERVGRTPFGFERLRAGFVADDRLEVAHHHWIGVRAGDRANAVEGVGDVGDPVPQRLVHGVLERLRPRFHRAHLGAQRLHAQHVRLLPLDVDHAHIDDAFEAELRAHGCGRNPVHAGAGFGDDARLAHAAREQDLAEHVVDLVRAGVIEVLALEIDFRPAPAATGGTKMLGQPLGEIERRRPPDVVLEVAVHLAAEAGIVLRLGVSLLQLENERHQRLGDEAAAIEPEMPAFVGPGAERVELLDGHARLMALSGAASVLAPSRAAAMKARILSWSFSPGARSTPEETSTPGAAVMRSASATLRASRPPESMNGTRVWRFSSSRQSKRLPSPPGRVALSSARASKISRSATPS